MVRQGPSGASSIGHSRWKNESEQPEPVDCPELVLLTLICQSLVSNFKFQIQSPKIHPPQKIKRKPAEKSPWSISSPSNPPTQKKRKTTEKSPCSISSPSLTHHPKKKQISEQRAESQRIVAKTPLSHVQYPVPLQVVCEGSVPQGHAFTCD